VVEPAASLPLVALRNKAVVVEVNPEPTPVTRYAQFYFKEAAGKFLPELYSAIKP
jgi:NAD-dependent deacetylase